MNIRIGDMVACMVILILFTSGMAVGADVGEDKDDSTKLSITVPGPVLNYRNITRNGTIAEGGESILLENQGQVDENVNVTLNYTSVGGLDRTGYVNASAWYDENQDDSYWFENRSGRANYRWKLEYDNTTATGSWSLVTDHPYNEVSLVSTEKLWSNSTTENWTIELSWNKQIKHALPETGVWGDNSSDPDYEGELSTTFDSSRSWNVNWSIYQTTSGLTRTWHNEYGIYKYVNVTAESDVTGSGFPGQTIAATQNGSVDEVQNTLQSNLTMSSNDNFNTSVSINHTFDNGPDPKANDGSDTIDIQNVYVNTSRNNPDWIENYTQFQSLGEQVFLNHSNNITHEEESNWTKLNTTWLIDIPMATRADHYQTAITYEIKMDVAWDPNS